MSNAPGSQYFGIGQETTYGTAIVSSRLLEVESDTFTREVTNDIREGFRKGQHTTPHDRNRSVTMGATGSIELPFYFNGMGILLRSAFPSPAAGKTAWKRDASTPVYDGSYATDIGAARNSYTLMMNRANYAGGLNKFWYTGMTCTKFGLNIAGGEAVKATFDYAGAGEQTTAPTGTEGGYPTIGSWFHFDDCILTINDKSVIPMKSFDLQCDFGLSTDLRYLTGPPAAARAKPARASLPSYTGTIETNMLDASMHTAWVAGDTIAIQLFAKNSFVVSTVSYSYELKITIRRR